MKNSKGFTLIEVIIVVAIIAILTAIAIPTLLSMRSGMNTKSSALTLHGDLLWARGQAVSRNTNITVTFNNVADGDSTNDSYTMSIQSSGTDIKTNTLRTGIMFGYVNGIKGVDNSTLIAGAIDLPTGPPPTLDFDAMGRADNNGGIYLIPAADLPSETKNMMGIGITAVTGNIKIYEYSGGTWVD